MQIYNEADFIALQAEKNAMMDVTAAGLEAENALFDDKILLNDQWNEQQLEQYDKDIALAKKLADEKLEVEKNLAAQKIAVAGQVADAASSVLDADMAVLEGSYNKEVRLAGANEEELEKIEKKYAGKREKIANQQKKMAVAVAIMNTYLAISEVWKDPTLPSTTLKILASVAMGIAGFQNVKKIMATDVGSAGGGGGGDLSAPSQPAPQMMSGSFDLTGGVEPEPTKAFVVTDEMTSSQNQLANIRRRATI